MNTCSNNIIVNGVEVIDASDMVEYVLDSAMYYTREELDAAEISNWDGWAGGDTVNLEKGKEMKIVH